MPDPWDHPEDEPTLLPPDSYRRGRRPPGRGPVVAAILLVIVLAGGWWWWASSRGAEEPAPAPVPTAVAAPPDTAQPALEIPELSASDEFVRNMATGLSSHPAWSKWLVHEDLARRFIASVASVSTGNDPRQQLAFLAPEGTFRVRRMNDHLYVDTASYHRYDAVAETFSSLDTQGTAKLFEQLHPLFEKAYADLGLPKGRLDDTFARAVGKLLAVPVPTGPVEVVQSGEIYKYANAQLEKLNPAQKQLLRMGPENERKIQQKLKDLSDAMGIQPTGAS